VTVRWADLVDPTRDELLTTLPVPVDPEVIEALLAPSDGARVPRPILESHGRYVFGTLVAMPPAGTGDDRTHTEIGIVATPERLVTVRKTSQSGALCDLGAVHAAAESDASVGVLIYRLVDDVADTYLDLLDAIYGSIDRLEDQIDDLQPAEVRRRLAELRHELLHRRRTISAMRAAVRRVLDGRVEIGEHALFPPDVERLFGDTYDVLVRATEELDIARDLLAGARDHLQAKISENQNEVGKKLTVIASLVLVPSFIVGYYGQNFAGVFDRGFWTLGVSSGLIVVVTLIQLAIFRWRRWI
jgi:Mg2+ and Co2+ transporter CorA